MLVTALRERAIEHLVLDMTPGGLDRRDSAFSWSRAIELLRTFPQYIRYILQPIARVYLLIGQSRVSFLRDALYIWIAALRGHRITVHLHGGNYGAFYAEQPAGLRWIIRLTLNRVEHIVVLSECLRGAFGFLPRAAEQIAVVRNGLPLAPVEHTEARTLAPGEPIRLLYLSSMIESKGYWDVLEACRLLKERHVPFHTDFCGEFSPARDDQRYTSAAEAQAAFLRSIKAWQLTDAVTWHGNVAGEQKVARLRQAHCLILPTRYYNEGQPVSIIEALAFGKVILATPYRAIPDMLVHDYNGYFVDALSPQTIADRVEWLWRHPDDVQRLSANSVSHFRAQFTREQHVDSLLRVLLS
ncbi:MAG: glycosyltransferase family 4 protein [Chloroflexota bacterium]|nr:glycosyltransferase family 4 protein [Chloroflexota bacterium]